jgi:hypothetical protein
MSGNVSVYQDGFTSLVDIEQGNYFGRLVLQYATFGPKGFEPNTGRWYGLPAKQCARLTNKLNMPVGLKQVNMRTWYITSMGDGTLLKASYYNSVQL